MTIDRVKALVLQNKNVLRSFRFKGTRNQVDEFSGVITDVYPAIFIIRLSDSKVKSFSYSDLLVENLEIID